MAWRQSAISHGCIRRHRDRVISYGKLPAAWELKPGPRHRPPRAGPRAATHRPSGASLSEGTEPKRIAEISGLAEPRQGPRLDSSANSRLKSSESLISPASLSATKSHRPRGDFGLRR